MCPEFSNPIELIADFWRQFSNNPIRGRYNYLKHRGKPLYEELVEHLGPKFMGLNIHGEDCPTDARDVQKRINLTEAIEELHKFDEKILFPYLQELFRLLEISVQPSPFI